MTQREALYAYVAFIGGMLLVQYLRRDERPQDRYSEGFNAGTRLQAQQERIEKERREQEDAFIERIATALREARP